MHLIENTECGLIGKTPIKNEKKPEIDIIKIKGIYKIINKIDGKYYVGSSSNIYKRWNAHKNLSLLHQKTHFRFGSGMNGDNIIT
jgi:hypothetical protein